MKNYSFRISKKDNDDKRINDLLMKLPLYSDSISTNFDNINYIQVDIEITDDINEDELKNLINPFRYRG